MNVDNANVPIPLGSGSSGDQVSADTEDDLVPAQSFGENHIAEAIETIVNRNSRSLGGEVGSALVAAATRQLAEDKLELRKENGDLISALSSQRSELEASRIRCAVLSERQNSEVKNRHLRNLGITVGVGLVGVGIDLARGGIDANAIGAIVVGCLLTLLSWFSTAKGDVE